MVFEHDGWKFIKDSKTNANESGEHEAMMLVLGLEGDK